MYFNGMQIIESNMCIKGMTSIPKRINKSKRIQKKWIKKYGYRCIPDPKVYIVGGKVIGHPLTIRKIKNKAKGK